MALFLKKIFSFIGLTLGLLLLHSWLSDYYYNRIKFDENQILIWGDSQTFQGIDLGLFRKFSGKQAITWAKHGNGVYDFLCFAEKVPARSHVLLTLSKPMQLRTKDLDRNESGISLVSIVHLAQNNYKLSEIASILRKNVLVEKQELLSTQMYDYSDSVLVSEDVLRKFENATSEVPEYLLDKQKLMLIGIQWLRDKDCDISLVEFPTDPIIQKMEQSSVVHPKIQQFKLDVCEGFLQAKIDTIMLDERREVMHDLTHLNELGAVQVSEKLGTKIKEQQQTTLYIVELGGGIHPRKIADN